MRFTQCPCCHEPEWDLFWENKNPVIINNWRDFMYGGSRYIESIWRCKNCGYAYIDPPISGDEYYNDADLKTYSSLAPARMIYFNDVKQQIMERSYTTSKFKSILDIGSGTGEWLDCWNGVAIRDAVEVNPRYIQELKIRNIRVFKDLGATEGGYDMISAFDFLEHVECPGRLLQIIRSKLSPQGIVVLGVPNMGKWTARLFGHRYYLYCPMHYSYFTKSSLESILKQIFSVSPNIFESPPMRAKWGSIAKWVAPSLENTWLSNFWIPLGYRASLIALVSNMHNEQTE